MHILLKSIPPGILLLFASASIGHASVMPAGRQDQPELFNQFIGDTQFSSNVYTLDKTAGAKGQPATQPWSGSYWPLESGGIADPYNEGISPWVHLTLQEVFGTQWSQNRFEKRIAKIRSNLNSLDSDTIDQMSPAEKYDLYLGDSDFSLTYAVWQSISEEIKNVGRIKLWEGSCQGWSTASIYSPRPTRAIKVMSLDGKYFIPFYPDDLKALATLLWANSLIQDHTTLLGSLCQNKDPDYDHHNGKVLNTTCQGVNPGDFHVAVLELMGNRKESFVVNRTNNTQVWNQPISNYEIEYFNPLTDKSGSLSDSVVARNSVGDTFASYRSPNTQFLVGVNMKLKYSSETKASHKATNTEDDDLVKTLTLKYDLELSGNGDIIGGEWRSGADSDTDADDAGIPKFPGFIWKFEMNEPQALSVGDFNLPESIADMTQATLVDLSKKAAQFRYNHYQYDTSGNIIVDANGLYVVDHTELKPQPFSKVVNELLKLSRAQ